ncbi:IPT/TIG domain-containing protein [Nocardia sp. KC 131]|uniref:IPT/TIG domain-containing protein n=1 Tax=Nocardia arseniciresistens TaxID=3392119 RepID=UPI00398E6BAF
MANITGVSPCSAKVGQQMVITGSGFKGVTRVFFENVNFKKFDAQFTVDSPTQITLTVPVTSYGTLHVFVMGTDGQESTIPRVPVLESDGDHLSSAGTGGVNWSARPGTANQVNLLCDDGGQWRPDPFQAQQEAQAAANAGMAAMLDEVTKQDAAMFASLRSQDDPNNPG